MLGVDASRGMIAEARRLGRERYEVADASRLPFADASFDLVTLNNMIPFFDELDRVIRPGGLVAIAFSMGDRTPIWVPLPTVRAGSSNAALPTLRTSPPAAGLALLARKDERGVRFGAQRRSRRGSTGPDVSFCAATLATRRAR